MTVFDMASEEFTSLLKENQELKKQLKDKTEDYRRMKDNFDSKVDVLTRIETQQKEFIKYINNIINDLETEDADDEEMKGYLIQRIDTFKEILQKYREIIGDNKKCIK